VYTLPELKKIFINFEDLHNPLKMTSQVDGTCSKCKEKYEINSEVVTVESKRFLQLWKGNSKEISFQDAINELEIMENSKQSSTNFENEYSTFHLECWKERKMEIRAIYSPSMDDNYRISSGTRRAKELEDDFNSTQHHFSTSKNDNTPDS